MANTRLIRILIILGAEDISVRILGMRSSSHLNFPTEIILIIRFVVIKRVRLYIDYRGNIQLRWKARQKRLILNYKVYFFHNFILYCQNYSLTQTFAIFYSYQFYLRTFCHRTWFRWQESTKIWWKWNQSARFVDMNTAITDNQQFISFFNSFQTLFSMIF